MASAQRQQKGTAWRREIWGGINGYHASLYNFTAKRDEFRDVE